jgi:hypothetical protein
MAGSYAVSGNIPHGEGSKDAIMVSIPPVNRGGWPKLARFMLFADFEGNNDPPTPGTSAGVKIRVAYGRAGAQGYDGIKILTVRSHGVDDSTFMLPEGTEKISIFRLEGQPEDALNGAVCFRIDGYGG